MATSTIGQQPLAASGFASGYDAAQNALAKKRKLAELLQQQALTNNDDPALHTPGAKMSWLSPIAKMAQLGTAAYLDSKATDEEKANAANRMTALTDLLNKPPEGTPAVDAIPGTPDTPAQPAQNAMFGPTPDQGTSPLATSLAPPKSTPPQASGGGIDFAQKLLAANPPPKPIASGGPSSAANLMQGTAPDAPKPLQDASGTPFLLPQRPATDMVPGTPGTPGVPAKPATPQEWLAYGSQLATLGPTGAKIGEQITNAATTQMLPKSPKDRYMSTGNGDVLDLQAEGGPKFLPGSPMAAVKQAEVAQNHTALLQARADSLAQQAALYDKTDARYRDLAAQHNDVLRELAAGRRAQGQQGTYTYAGNDKDGNPMMVNTRTNVMVPAGAGTPGTEGGTPASTTPGKGTAERFVPSKDNPLIRTGEQKGVDAASGMQSKIKQANSLADAIEADAVDNPKGGAYSPGNNVKGMVNYATGGALFHPSDRLTPAQMAMRANAGRDFSVEMHDLFGASFTNSEGKSARDYNIKPFMNATEVAAMLRAQAKFREEGMAAYPEKFRNIAAQRTGGGSAPPTAPAATVGGRSDAERKAMDKYGIK